MDGLPYLRHLPNTELETHVVIVQNLYCDDRRCTSQNGKYMLEPVLYRTNNWEIEANTTTRLLCPSCPWDLSDADLGHERSLTQIKFNREGDLLFSCSKDHVINVWFSHNGERLGTYDGHNGSVWTVDVDGAYTLPSHTSWFWLEISSAETKYFVSGAADNTLRLWSVQTGKCLYTWEFPTAVKRVAFNEEGDQVVCITEQRMGFQCAIRVFKINREDGTKRTLYLPSDYLRALIDLSPKQNQKNLCICSIQSDQKLQFALSRRSKISSSPVTSPGKWRYSMSRRATKFKATSGRTVMWSLTYNLAKTGITASRAVKTSLLG